MVPVVLVKVTVPLGVIAVPAATSVTVAVHVALAPAANVAGEQLTVVVVPLGFTVTLADPLLAAWFASPP
jgi:hypothetical protein